MKDIDIRQVLLASFQNQYKNDKDTRIIPELGLCQGNARVDLAIVNGLIHGYEIKSEKDTLNRLSGQQDIYNKVLNRVTVVASSRHLSKINKAVPRWWGISEAKSNNNKVSIIDIRPCKENKLIDPSALVQLLWRDEAFTILKERNLHKGLSKKPRIFLWNTLIDYLSINELQIEIRQRLKTRQYWRPVVSQKSNDD